MGVKQPGIPLPESINSFSEWTIHEMPLHGPLLTSRRMGSHFRFHQKRKSPP